MVPIVLGRKSRQQLGWGLPWCASSCQTNIASLWEAQHPADASSEENDMTSMRPYQGPRLIIMKFTLRF